MLAVISNNRGGPLTSLNELLSCFVECYDISISPGVPSEGEGGLVGVWALTGPSTNGERVMIKQ